MKSAEIILGILGILGVCAAPQRTSSQTPVRTKRIVIAASTVLDGKGGVVTSAHIIVDGAKIVALALWLEWPLCV